MDLLPEKRKEAQIAVYNPPPGTRAIDIRRKMVELPEVAKALTPVEKYIFSASTKTQIKEMDDNTLVGKTSQMFKFISMDVGFRIPTDPTEWQYICTRLLDVLKRYYSDLTLADIKLAFELATMGELNEYLPKDSQGNPDKNHYQQFNADYFGKILNAFRRKQQKVIGKAYDALPEPSREISPEEKKRLNNTLKNDLIYSFLKYKYCGKFDRGSGIAEMLFYNELVEVGLAENIVVTIEEKKAALGNILNRVANGMINKYTGNTIRKEGLDNDSVKYGAYSVARVKALIASFDRMIKEEIQITDFIKLEK